MSEGLRIERVVTSGVFELDGGAWDVDNNVWIIGHGDATTIGAEAPHLAEWVKRGF